jgi:homoserine O-acetyltransferase
VSTQAGPFSQSFYREQCDLKGLGFPSLDAFIVGFFEHMFLNVEANNLLAMLATWQAADVSDTDQFKGDFAKALGSIKAKAFVMPCRTDLNFPHEDSEVDPVDSQCRA